MNRWIGNRLRVLALCAVGMFSLSGCLGDRNWEYPPHLERHYLGLRSTHTLPFRVVVLPLEDRRGEVSQTEYWKVAIPLIPTGTTIYDRPEKVRDPEEVDVVSFDPPRDFARALADEMREAGIFSSVTYVEGASLPPTDLVLRGELRSTKWERVITTYLMGPVGTVFWILGLPMGYTTTTVDMDLHLAPLKNPSKILWSFSMEFEGWQLDGPYYGLEDAVQSYPLALQEALRPAITDLVDRAEKHPDSLQSTR